MNLQDFLSNLYQKLRSKDEVGTDLLAKALSLRSQDLRSVPLNYRLVKIPKANGTDRILEIPPDPLKLIQRRIYCRLLRRLQPHDAALGFRPGISTAHHASRHVRKAVIIKLDIADFFRSTSSAMVERFFEKLGWNLEASKVLSELTTFQGHLPQGAPTSPALSNLLNRRMDARLAGLAKTFGAVYSRYADDMAFSLDHDHRENVRAICISAGHIVRQSGYRLNVAKSRRIRQHQRQSITGLVVNEKLQIPRETRRLLRAVRYRLESGKAATMDFSELSGWEAYQSMVRKQSE